MIIQKNDFVEIEFTGKNDEGKVFDSNIKEGLSQIEGADTNNAKPFIFAIGHDMFLKGIDEFLIGKEAGKDYTINLEAADAFGPRDSKKVKLMPIKMFHEQKVNPVPGSMFNFDGQIAKVLSVNGGRVMVDFNNPLAGKDVTYEVKIVRKLDDMIEKTAAFNEFLFRKKMNFEIKDKKIILKVEEMLLQFAPMFASKYKEVLDLDLEVVKEAPLQKQGSSPEGVNSDKKGSDEKGNPQVQ
ncbi:MAG: peptidylprolyl isomerase [Candidatus Omnitrophica bacterium]|nr:peptidylprolyl isomerase [Candidatus Omnitrophota bacterium]